MRLDDAITYFLGEWPAEGPTADTVRAYSGQLKWLVGFAAKRGKTRLADLTPDLLRAAMLHKMDPRNHSLSFKGGEASADALANAARKLARWLKTQGVPVADLSVVVAPKVPERIQPRLRQDEFKALEAAILRRLVSAHRRVPRLAIARDLALIYLLADTGLRANEVCAMDVQHVDFATSSVVLTRGKGKKQRALSLVDANDPNGGVTLRLLTDWIDLRRGIRGATRHNRLWVSMLGNPLSRSELRKVLGRICEAAGMDTNRPPHTFRRANFTENYVADPGSIQVLAARMGWSDKSHHMIDVYTRGAAVEVARTTPMPSVSARWHSSTPNNLPQPTLQLVSAGPGWGKANGPPPVRREGKTGERTALANPRKGRRTSS